MKTWETCRWSGKGDGYECFYGGRRGECATCRYYDRLDVPKPTDREKRFRAWFRKVNTTFIAISGMDVADVPDMPYWDMFDDHMTPMRAARHILKECMMF